MPQLFQVLKCYRCSVFQVHQIKKSNKWECKLCGEKQSIKRHYGLGTGKECRLHVQKLNGIRGEIDELNESIELNPNSDVELENSRCIIDINTSDKRKKFNGSKWSNFMDETELSPKPEASESSFLGNSKVVLEVPVRKRKKFKPPTSPNYLPNEPAYKYETNNKPIYNYNVLNELTSKTTTGTDEPEVSTSNYNTFFKTISNPKAPVKENSIGHPEIYKHSNITTEIKEQISTQDQNNLQVKTYVPPKVNKNSKWAEFADEPDENEVPSKESSPGNLGNIFLSQETPAENISLRKAKSSENVTKHLFSLCDENELDDVLEF